MSIRNKIIIGSILIAIGFWVVDSIIDVLVFTDGSFLDALILHPSSYEIYIRSLGTMFIVIPGLFVAITYSNLKKAEISLANSEERFKAIFDTTADGILLMDGKNEKIFDANQAMCRMLGYTGDEIKKLGLIDIHPQSELPIIKGKFEALPQTDPILLRDIPVKRRDNGVIYTDINSVPVTFSGKTYQLGIFRDATERKKAEEALRETNNDLRIAQSLTKIGNWKWILASDKTLWSEELRHINGWDPELPVPRFEEMERFYTPESWKRLTVMVTNALATGQPFELEASQIRTDGSGITTFARGEADIDEAGNITGLHGTVQDITDRKRIEQQLYDSEQLFRSQFEHSNIGIAVTSLDKRWLQVNARLCEMLGYTEHELKKMTWTEITHPDDLGSDMTQFNRVLVGAIDSYEMEKRFFKKNGSLIYVFLTAACVRNSDKSVKYFVASAQDITQRKNAEETLRMQADLLDAELDSVYVHDFDGRFVYVNKASYITHGYTKEELLGMKLWELDEADSAKLIPERLKEILDNKEATFEVTHHRKNGSLIPLEIHSSLIEVGGEKMVMSVAHDMSQRQKIQQQLMAQDRLASIGQLVSGVAHELNNPLTSVIGFSDLLLIKNLPEDVKIDLKIINDEAHRTAKIVQNLLTFARKQPEGKIEVQLNEQILRVLALRSHEQAVNNIHVDTYLAPELPCIMGNASQMQQVFFNIIVNAEQAMLEANHKGTLTITSEQSAATIRLSFADDGPGISPEHMNRLFTPFFTTKELGKGTGLGLSICHGIITEHGGKIYAKSEFGKGTTFIIEFPVSGKEQT